MNKSNYHTHCKFCDGYGEPAEYADAAMKKGFKALGFSSHIPIPFRNEWSMDIENLTMYLDTISDLKQAYKDRLNIYLSLEADYFQDAISPAYRPDVLDRLDYIIGAVHYLKLDKTGEYLNVDGNAERYRYILFEGFNDDIKEMVACYYKTVREMTAAFKPDIIAHLDIIKKNNTGGMFFSDEDEWYRNEVMKTLDVIYKNKCVIEINTGGMTRAGMDIYYPAKWILKECKSTGIPVVLNSDAHRPEHLDSYFEFVRNDQAAIGLDTVDFERLLLKK